MGFSFKDKKLQEELSDKSKDLEFFTLIDNCSRVYLPFNSPSPVSINSSTLDIDVLSVKLIETPIAYSLEGQNLSGNKFIIDLKITEKILYTGLSQCENVFSVNNTSFIKSIYVVVPKEYNGKSICKIARTNSLLVTPLVLDSKIRLIDKDNVFSYISLLINVTLF